MISFPSRLTNREEWPRFQELVLSQGISSLTFLISKLSDHLSEKQKQSIDKLWKDKRFWKRSENSNTQVHTCVHTYVQCVFSVCVQCVFSVCVQCVFSVYVQCVFSVCVQCVFSVCTVCVQCVYGVCLRCMFSVYTVCVKLNLAKKQLVGSIFLSYNLFLIWECFRCVLLSSKGACQCLSSTHKLSANRCVSLLFKV